MAKIRKFASGSDVEEAKFKTAGLAASNAELERGERKPSGFLGLGRLFQGNIDQKGSEAYNLYGAGYGREVEAKNDRLKAETKREPAAPAPAAKETNYRSSGDYDDTADMKRKQGSAKATEATSAKPAAVTTFTKVNEDMPVVRPSGGAQVKAGDARPAEYANTFPSAKKPSASTGTAGAAAAAARSAAAAKAAAAKAAADEANRTRRSDREEDRAVPKPAAEKPLSQDELKADADKARESGNSSGSKDPYADDITLSLEERRKRLAQRIKRRTNSDKETPSKSVTERFKESFKAKGGAIQSYAKGGAVSASRRGDGIAQRGKTRGKMY